MRGLILLHKVFRLFLIPKTSSNIYCVFCLINLLIQERLACLAKFKICTQYLTIPNKMQITYF